jgi:AcrR family transcriptional regulator
MGTKTTAPASARTSARERLLAAANELFYKEGVHTVGIDRVIEHAGVAKATLYSAFGSKDELIRAYLAGRHEVRRARMTEQLARYDTPRERLLGVFDVLGDSFTDPAYHGCAFVNASAEAGPGSPILEVTGEYRGWVRNLFVDLARAAGIAEPEVLARQLVLLYDGAGIAARMDRDPGAAAAAREVAAALVAAAPATATKTDPNGQS